LTRYLFIGRWQAADKSYWLVENVREVREYFLISVIGKTYLDRVHDFKGMNGLGRHPKIQLVLLDAILT